MKTLKNLFPLFAILLGIALFFTQSAFKNPVKRQTAWFLLDESNGQLDPSHTQVDPEDLCGESGSKYCAREYNVIDDEPISPTTTAPRMKQ